MHAKACACACVGAYASVRKRGCAVYSRLALCTVRPAVRTAWVGQQGSVGLQKVGLGEAEGLGVRDRVFVREAVTDRLTLRDRDSDADTVRDRVGDMDMVRVRDGDRDWDLEREVEGVPVRVRDGDRDWDLERPSGHCQWASLSCNGDKVRVRLGLPSRETHSRM